MPTKNKSLVNILGITSQSPRPVDHPAVDAHLQRLDALARSTDCIRYSLLSIEYWISPDGHIREWLRRNLRCSAVLMIPTITVFPIVTVALWELEAWTNALTTIASKLVFLAILALLALISLTIVLRIVSVFKR